VAEVHFGCRGGVTRLEHLYPAQPAARAVSGVGGGRSAARCATHHFGRARRRRPARYRRRPVKAGGILDDRCNIVFEMQGVTHTNRPSRRTSQISRRNPVVNRSPQARRPKTTMSPPRRAAPGATMILAPVGRDPSSLIERARGVQSAGAVDGLQAGVTCVAGLVVARWLAADAAVQRGAFADLACHLRQAAMGLPLLLPRSWHV